jgi:hypothetical protein
VAGLHPQAPALRIGHLPGPPAAYAASHQQESGLLSRLLAAVPVWTNFEFRDEQGKWHEVDAIVLGQRRMHLLELKYYFGTLRDNDHQWLTGIRPKTRRSSSPGARRSVSPAASATNFSARAGTPRTGSRSQAGCSVRAGSGLPAPPAVALRAANGLPAGPVLPGRPRGGHRPPGRQLTPAGARETDARYFISTNRSEIIARLMERIGAARPVRGSSTTSPSTRAMAGRTGPPTTG